MRRELGRWETHVSTMKPCSRRVPRIPRFRSVPQASTPKTLWSTTRFTNFLSERVELVFWANSIAIYKNAAQPAVLLHLHCSAQPLFSFWFPRPLIKFPLTPDGSMSAITRVKRSGGENGTNDESSACSGMWTNLWPQPKLHSSSVSSSVTTSSLAHATYKRAPTDKSLLVTASLSPEASTMRTFLLLSGSKNSSACRCLATQLSPACN